MAFLNQSCSFNPTGLSRTTCRSTMDQQFLLFRSTDQNRNFRLLLKCFAEMKAKSEPENQKWRVCGSHGGMINGAATHNYVGNLLPGSSFSTNSSDSPEGIYCNGRDPPEDNKLSDSIKLLDKLRALQLHLLASEQWNASHLKLCNSNYLASATNLSHYLAFQSLDLDQLKKDLSAMGLLNLDSVTAHIFASVSAAVKLLEGLVPSSGRIRDDTGDVASVVHQISSCHLARDSSLMMMDMASSHAARLFGPSQNKRRTSIMVTVGKEAISDGMLIAGLLNAGADVIRINCGHDDPSVWDKIIRTAKESSRALGRPCRILMDLAGPKFRTGAFVRDENVIRVSPKVDASGVMSSSPAKVWLHSSAKAGHPCFLSPDATLCLDPEFLEDLGVGDVLWSTDLRGKKVSFKVVMDYEHGSGHGYMAECWETAHIGLGTKLFLRKKKKKKQLAVGTVQKMPAMEQYIVLNTGDLLTISKKSCTCADNSGSSASSVARLTCSSDDIIGCVEVGDPIAFNDGKVWGEVKAKSNDEITVQITIASPRGSTLGSKKSINLPRSKVLPKGLTPKDLADLDFVAARADMVGISFLRDAEDMAAVQRELEKRTLAEIGVVLKVETRDAVEKLPELLFQAMQTRNPVGVMVARGDLMVEDGWDHMVDTQEKVLSLCHAAHVPVIWATQVLESLIKFGYPTRAEVTDIGKGMKTSCVMLNKGGHIVEAVSALNSIFSKTSKEKKMTL